MIKISLMSHEGTCTGFTASGHAGYATIGQDIVIINNESASVCYVYTTSQINLAAYYGLIVEMSNEYTGNARSAVSVYYGASVTSVGIWLGGVNY